MELKELSKRALEIRKLYAKLEEDKYGKQWTTSQIMEGFVGDVGNLIKIVMAKNGVREIKDMDEKLKHELSDCLYCILVLAKEYNIDIENSFLKTMDELENRLEKYKN